MTSSNRHSASTNNRRPNTNTRRAPVRSSTPRSTMPLDYPVVSVQQALADGTRPWTLKVLANRLSRDYPAQAAELRRVAAQLAASNDNARNDARRVA